MTIRATASQPISPTELRELASKQTTTDVQTTARAFGRGQQAVYEAIQRGDWTATRVFKMGRVIRIPISDILTALGLTAAEGEPASGGDAA